MKEIGRLKLKFMFYNMLIVTAVIGVTFFASAAVVRERGFAQTDEVLGRIADGEIIVLDAAPTARVPYFSLLVEPDGTVLLQEGNYQFRPGQEILEELAAIGLDGGETGMVPGYHLKYIRSFSPDGTMFVFADTSYGEAVVNGMLRTGILACGGIWLLFFLLSWLFSSWAVRPVERAVTSQKEFVANASHELKTPLTIITANTRLLERTLSGTSPQVDRWITNTRQECEEMRRLTESLLSLARSDLKPEQKREWKRFDFSEILMEELLTFEPLFYQAGKTLSYGEFAPAPVMGNREELRSVITILLDNAVKYGKPGGRTEVSLDASGSRRLSLRVKSEGEPIPPEERSRIFARFYRGSGDGGGKRPEGHGLGLAIAKEIASRHHARLGLSCEEDGNCFYLRMKKTVGKPHIFEKMFRSKSQNFFQKNFRTFFRNFLQKNI